MQKLLIKCLKQNENYEKLEQKYGINNINVFNSGCLVFNTNLLTKVNAKD